LRQREDVIPIRISGHLRDRIEALRRELYSLYERNASSEEILAVSRQLDALMTRALQQANENRDDTDVSES